MLIMQSSLTCFEKIIIASADTDVFICLMYHFRRWNELDLKELWVISGQGCSARAVPVHSLVTIMDPCVADIMPAVHALSGCDTS